VRVDRLTKLRRFQYPTVPNDRASFELHSPRYPFRYSFIRIRIRRRRRRPALVRHVDGFENLRWFRQHPLRHSIHQNFRRRFHPRRNVRRTRVFFFFFFSSSFSFSRRRRGSKLADVRCGRSRPRRERDRKLHRRNDTDSSAKESRLMSIFPARTNQEAQKKEQERDSQRRRRRRRRKRRAGGTGFAPCFHRSFRSFRACFVSLLFPEQRRKKKKTKMVETLNKKVWKKKTTV